MVYTYFWLVGDVLSCSGDDVASSVILEENDANMEDHTEMHSGSQISKKELSYHFS